MNKDKKLIEYDPGKLKAAQIALFELSVGSSQPNSTTSYYFSSTISYHEIQEVIRNALKERKFLETYKFITKELPEIVKRILVDPNFKLSFAPNIKSGDIGDFSIKSLLRNEPTHMATFTSLREIIAKISSSEINAILKKNVCIFGIDESEVDVLMEGSIFKHIRSVAYKMTPYGEEEVYLVRPIFDPEYDISEKSFNDSRMKFLEYSRNLYIVLKVIEDCQSKGLAPIIFLHGPLVRPLGIFDDKSLIMKHEDLLKCVDRDDNLVKKFYESIKDCYDKIIQEEGFLIGDEIVEKISPYMIHDGRIKQDSEKGVNQTEYSPILIYLLLLREVYEKLIESNGILVGVVENISKSSELTSLVLSSMHNHINIYHDEELTKIKEELYSRLKDLLGIISPQFRDFYELPNRLPIRDITLFTQILKESEYTTPVPTFRYMSEEFFRSHFDNRYLGIRRHYERFLKRIFPYPEYQVLVSYIRTSPLREPIRVEFFNIPKYNYDEILGLVYLLSIPYYDYGMPIILKFADFAARTPKKLMETIVKGEVMEILHEELGSDPETLLRYMGMIHRNFYDR